MCINQHSIQKLKVTQLERALELAKLQLCGICILRFLSIRDAELYAKEYNEILDVRMDITICVILYIYKYIHTYRKYAKQNFGMKNPMIK